MSAALTSASMAEVAIYGQVEESISTQNSVSDVVGDNYIGVSVSESLSDTGMSAFAKVEFGVDEDASANADQIVNRQAYAGIDFGAVAVSAGKMENLKKTMANPVDIFQGNSFDVDGADRAADTVKVAGEVAGVTVAATTVLDGQAGSDSVGDTREVGASVALGGLTVSAVQTRTGSTSTTTNTFAASTEVEGVKLAVTHEPDLANKTTTVAGSMDFGANSVRLGNAFVTGGDNTVIGEVAHNFSKNVSAFVNYQKPQNTSATTMVGLSLTF